jgi:hypothetical protein
MKGEGASDLDSSEMAHGPATQPNAHSRVPRCNYAGLCWWCEAAADSREHRHKASDLRREFAPAEYAAKDVIISRSSGPDIAVRGPKAKAVTFEPNLCARCNNDRSQRFDAAYGQLIAWFLANEREVEETGLVRLDEIYDDHEVGSALAVGYFVKHIGCRIADYGFQVPQPPRDFLDGRSEPAGLAISFEMNGMLAGVHAIMRLNPDKGTGFLGQGPLTAMISRDRQYAHEFHGWWNYHGLQVLWEWKTEYPHSWTNLLGPTAELPLTYQREGRALLRVATPGPRGTFWKICYRLGRMLGFAPYVRGNTDAYVEPS